MENRRVQHCKIFYDAKELLCTQKSSTYSEMFLLEAR